jgi:hypothetical protein
MYFVIYEMMQFSLEGLFPLTLRCSLSLFLTSVTSIPWEFCGLIERNFALQSLNCRPLVLGFDMASALRAPVRRFATTALRTAAAEPASNSYGIRVSKAQGVVDTLTGGMS